MKDHSDSVMPSRSFENIDTSIFYTIKQKLGFHGATCSPSKKNEKFVNYFIFHSYSII